MQTPDITPAQATAWVTALVAEVVLLFKLNVSDDTRAVVTLVLASVVVAGFKFSDAIIRHGRSRALIPEAREPDQKPPGA